MSEKIYNYEVSFIGDDTSVRYVVSDDNALRYHDDIVREAMTALCKLWGTDSIPPYYYVVNVEVSEETL